MTQFVRIYKDILVYEDDLCLQTSASTENIGIKYSIDELHISINWIRIWIFKYGT